MSELKNHEIIKRLVDTNDNEYNYKKLLEELLELSEVVVKCITKSPEHRPPISNNKKFRNK